LFRTIGHSGDSGSITDIEAADLVLIVGSNTAESHPVIATCVKRSHKLNGRKLIVSDPRENEMARCADIFFHPNPGTDLFWLSAISRYLLDKWSRAHCRKHRAGLVRGVVKTIPEGIAHATAERKQLVTLFGLLRRFTSKDSLPGLAAAADFLQAFGRHLPSPGSSNS
jgi:predicted molibdopterin-dependent oxidoreductase YjgC